MSVSSRQLAGPAADVEELRSRVAGAVLVPDDPGWDVARAAWNLAVDQRPAMVVEPQGPADVQAVVDHARMRGLRVAMQGTGHNAAPLRSSDVTVLVKTSRMRGVTIDPDRRTARVEAGALWADVTAPASALGLAPLAGSSPDVGVVGYTVGGGVSWLCRRYGLATERVVTFEVVTADGRLLAVSRDAEPELFWALCGGGGSFAAVVAMEFELIELAEVYAGALIWPWERAAEVLHAWRQWTSTVPDGVTTAASIVQVPPLPDVPPFLRGRGLLVIDGASLGDEQTAAAILEPLRALGPEMDTFTMVPPAALSHLHMDPEQPVPGAGNGALLRELPADAVDALVDAAGPASGSPLLKVEIRHVAGAPSRSRTGALAVADGAYLVYGVGMAMDPGTAGAVETHLDRVLRLVEPYRAAHQLPGFSERPTAAETFFPPATLDRLRRIKADVDPGDLFQANHPVTAR